ncbi:DUF1467 family protein [Fodinicurvata sp. EGI_FJ10296]|uniref:DUF1467 family protein n=1 Tax=Fodinicurvata sp. EGI_FJ10296 TaxID=3231908 RepID=UPI00345466E4
MHWVSGIVVFFIVWWTVLFAILPIGIRPTQYEETEEGHQVGAPANPMLVRKAVQTTVVTCVIWLVIYGLVAADVFSFQQWASEIELS